MVMMFRYSRSYSWLLLLTICQGCTDESGPVGHDVRTVPAQGVLRLNGKPLAFHQVTFWPEEDRPAIGVTDENGHFILGTNRPEDGAVEGSHRISVINVGNPADDPMTMGVAEVGATTAPYRPQTVINSKYHKPETSGLTAEISAEGNFELQIELQ